MGFRTRSRLLAVGAAALVALATVTSALAVTGTGSGNFTAHGAGTATFTYGGVMIVSGSGTVKFRDNLGDAVVTRDSTDKGTDIGGGWKQLSAEDGSATITGSSVSVELSGDTIDLVVTGAGAATLIGDFAGTRSNGESYSVSGSTVDLNNDNGNDNSGGNDNN